MEQGFIDSIQKMVNDYGKDTLLDARKAKSMLSDFTQNGFPKETNVLKQLLDAQCAKLINEAGNVAEAKAGLAKRLEDEHAISPKFSVEMLDLLGLVLRGDKTKTASASAERAAPVKEAKPAPSSNADAKSAEDLWRAGSKAYGREDHKKAFSLFTQSAEQGNSDGQYSLGLCYAQGVGVEQDKANAAKWFRKAAQQGHPLANLKYKEFRRYDKSAKEDDIDEDLETLLEEGKKADRNEEYEEAFRIYSKAAAKGNVKAQLRLAEYYEIGLGVLENFAKAAEWYGKAAAQGDDEAQYQMGIYLYNGKGILKDEAKGIEWWRKSAAQGNKRGKGVLEQLKSEGKI